jgi:uncharacterized protein YuzE
MKVTISPRTNMAYIYLTDWNDARRVDYTEPLIVDLPNGSRRLINLDFDADGRLLGIEVDGAAACLPLSLLAAVRTSTGSPRSE